MFTWMRWNNGNTISERRRFGCWVSFPRSFQNLLVKNYRISLQQQAVQAAKAAFSSLNDDNVIFQQCLQSTEPISTIIQGLLAKHGSHTDKRSTRLLENFQKHTLWLQNMSPAIDVAVNASSGIACPVWAPIKYILSVSAVSCLTTELPWPGSTHDLGFSSQRTTLMRWSTF
jgi:hypothetical protein